MHDLNDIIMARHTDLPQSSHTFEISELDSERYIASPAITSLTLVSNWSKLAEESLRNAIQELVMLNPILTGRLFKDPVNHRVTVESSHYKDLFDIIEGPTHFMLPTDVHKQIQALHNHIEPLFDVLGVSLEQITSGSKLFAISVCTLPQSHACLLIQLSHMIADGATYYMILAQLQALLEGKNIEAIPKYKWIPSPSNILSPSFYTKEDLYRELKSWRPAFMKLAHDQPPRHSSIGIVDIKNVSRYKPGLVLAAHRAKTPIEFLSTNDLVTAALAEIFDTELMEMFANMRGRLDSVTTDIAANAERGIFFPRVMAISTPEYIRSVPMKQFLAWRDSSDMETYNTAFVEANFSVITNWSQLVTFIVPEGTTMIVHAPASSFVRAIPIDYCIVFKADLQGTIAINHNVRTEEESFKQRFDQSVLFKNIIRHQEPATTVHRDHHDTTENSNWIHVKRWIEKLRTINRWRAQAWGIEDDHEIFDR